MEDSFVEVEDFPSPVKLHFTGEVGHSDFDLKWLTILHYKDARITTDRQYLDIGILNGHSFMVGKKG